MRPATQKPTTRLFAQTPVQSSAILHPSAAASAASQRSSPAANCASASGRLPAQAAAAASALALGRARRAGRRRRNRRVELRAENGRTSRVIAVVGPDGAGKSKVCAGLLELADDESQSGLKKSFADKERFLEREPAESRRNFTCYNHVYSQEPESFHHYSPRLHLIDTPGHVDRLPQVEQALHMAHAALLVCSQDSGRDLASTHIISSMKASGKPLVVFLNRIDEFKDYDSFQEAVTSVEQSLGKKPAVLLAPALVDGDEDGVLLINVLDRTICSALECQLELSGPGLSSWGSTRKTAEGNLAELADQLSEELVDTLAAEDDEMMEAYVKHDGDVPRFIIEDALRRTTAAGRVIPLVAGSAKVGAGIDSLQEVLHNLTGDINVIDEKLLRKELGMRVVGAFSASPKAPFVGWVCGHRWVNDKQFAEVRVLSGTIMPQQRIIATGAGDGKQFAPAELKEHGPCGNLLDVEEAGPGDLFLAALPSGMTSGASGFLLSDKPEFEKVDEAPEQAPSVNHGCTFKLDLDKLEKKNQKPLLQALEAMTLDDAGLILHRDAKDEVLLSCMGALHLELIRERLIDEFKVMILPVGQPHIPYRATIRGSSKATGKHELEGKVTMRKGHVHKKQNKVDAWAKVQLKAGKIGSGIDIQGVSECAEKGHISKAAREALEHGLRRGLEHGGPGDVPIVDVHVTLVDAEILDEEAAVEAAVDAVRNAIRDAQDIALLEPIVDMEVLAPAQDIDSIMGDLQEKRRATILEQPSSKGEVQAIEVEVPLREVVGYGDDLRKLTNNKGTYSFCVSRYQEVPSELAKDILVHELERSASS
eukprot:TRINITY_DN4213_c0_g1_i3.p1 TRINITY_DN4213_c0_g1~~TRINITY_DN4213_c0_g1_i3.p1  ORF type:complete len:822 (+),score=210.64 TRINITY_DN4213_c0_g1_i3:137-2602(+)